MWRNIMKSTKKVMVLYYSIGINLFNMYIYIYKRCSLFPPFKLRPPKYWINRNSIQLKPLNYI